MTFFLFWKVIVCRFVFLAEFMRFFFFFIFIAIGLDDMDLYFFPFLFFFFFFFSFASLHCFTNRLRAQDAVSGCLDFTGVGALWYQGYPVLCLLTSQILHPLPLHTSHPFVFLGDVFSNLYISTRNVLCSLLLQKWVYCPSERNETFNIHWNKNVFYLSRHLFFDLEE